MILAELLAVWLACSGQCAQLRQADTLPAIPDSVQPAIATAFVVPGDCTGDSLVTMADIVYLIGYVLKGGPKPRVPSAPDTKAWYWTDSKGAHIVLQLGGLL